MLVRQLNYSKRLFLLLGGLLIAYKVSRGISLNSPDQAIKKAFQGSRYTPLIPFIVAQSKHETGIYKSEIFKNANNLFGMKVPFIRPSLRSGTYIARDGEKYSKFDSLYNSARDYRLYLENQNFPVVNTVFDYANVLKQRGYFEDNLNNYVNGLKRWI